MSSLVDIGSVVLEKTFQNFPILFRYYLPLEKRGVLPLNKREFPSPENALCQV